jgi:hypothetical protein
MNGENVFTECLIFNFEVPIGVGVNLLLHCQWHFQESAVIFISFWLHIHHTARNVAF